jgi:hypothetical protein
VRGFLFYKNMIDWLQNHLSPCFFKSHFGLECPGCGMQRAFIALLKGDLVQSLQFHPALIPFILTILALFIQLKVKHPKGGILVMWLFVICSLITIVNYITRQWILWSHQV